MFGIDELNNTAKISISLNLSKHIILVCAGKIEYNDLENRAVTSFE